MNTMIRTDIRISIYIGMYIFLDDLLLIKKISLLGPFHTKQVKTELTNQLARKVKTEISHLFEMI